MIEPYGDDDDIRERLGRDCPSWRLEDGTIVKDFRTYSWKGTMLLVGAVGHLAEAAWHHPELDVRFGSVTIRLTTHDAGAVTERDFALAAKIDEVVAWRPTGALEGPPPGPRHGYLRFED